MSHATQTPTHPTPTPTHPPHPPIASLDQFIAAAADRLRVLVLHRRNPSWPSGAVDDVLQETWLAVLTHWSEIASYSSLEAQLKWACRVALNKATDLDRVRTRHPQVSLDRAIAPSPGGESRQDSMSLHLSDLRAQVERELVRATLGTSLDTEHVIEARDAWAHLLARCETMEERLLVALTATQHTLREIVTLLREANIAPALTYDIAKRRLIALRARLAQPTQPA